ncbi:hypothetical protein GGR56DRAFT_631372 [Xylariaceae sp. FL0804]|nr:hypothetical protein GGR56DRAFT_631372 [Xylariaceae sp. FL0804]
MAPVLLALALSLASLCAASPYPRHVTRDLAADEACYTGEEGVAACTGVHVVAARDYTTTWTETRTYTSTISSWDGPTATPTAGASGENCVPPAGSGEIACGTICCASWQYCASFGDSQCSANAGVGTWSEWTTVGVVTTQFSAPYRVTSGSTIVLTTATGTAASATQTTTGGGATATPVAHEGTAGSLSPGAIAGIVVGTLAGVALLLLLCFCCIARGLWDVFAGIFGLGGRDRKPKERVEIIEERYSRHGSRRGSAYGGRPTHRRWFGGGGGGRPSAAGSRRTDRKESGGGLGWLVAGLGAVGVLLGLRRHDKEKDKRRASSHKPPRSTEYSSSSYFTDSYLSASSPSEFISRR